MPRWLAWFVFLWCVVLAGYGVYVIARIYWRIAAQQWVDDAWVKYRNRSDVVSNMPWWVRKAPLP